MKRFLKYLLSIFSTLFGGRARANADLGNQQALAEIRNELKVKEAIISNLNVLYISVIDDGTNRKGLAEYFCEILRENNAMCHEVKIVEYGTKSNLNRYGRLLGEAKY